MSEPKSEAASAGPAAEKSADELLAGADPVPKQPYRDRKREHKLLALKDEHQLRGKVARYAYLATGVQILAADVTFVLIAWRGYEWRVPVEAIVAWLSATVVQVVGVVLVITRYLFPPPGRLRDRSRFRR